MLHDPIGYGKHLEHTAGWTDERIEQLKKLWLDGLSASQIASILGGGVTRNGVIGKINRLKLAKRSAVSMRATKATGNNGSSGKYRGVVNAARKARTQGQPKAAAISHRLTMGELKPPKALPVPTDLPELSARRRLIDLKASECRYCNGDPLTADHSFCGNPVKPGTSWCERHYAVVFTRRVP